MNKYNTKYIIYSSCNMFACCIRMHPMYSTEHKTIHKIKLHTSDTIVKRYVRTCTYHGAFTTCICPCKSQTLPCPYLMNTQPSSWKHIHLCTNRTYVNKCNISEVEKFKEKGCKHQEKTRTTRLHHMQYCTPVIHP